MTRYNTEDLSELAIRLFGFPRIERDGSPLALDRRKALALVAFLALSPRPRRRDELLALLWPELDGPRARRALRRTLFDLRRVAGEGLLISNGDELNIEIPTVFCDAGELLRATESDASMTLLERARTLYCGSFLQGLTLRDAQPFEEWQTLESERFRNRVVSVLEKLTAAYAAQGRRGEALECARQLLTEDPFHETAHRSIMELYQSQGRPEHAIAQYQRYESLLREQLDLEPSPDMIAARARIRSRPSAPGELHLRALGNQSDNPRRRELEERLDTVTDSFDIKGQFEEGASWIRTAVSTLPVDDPLVPRLSIRLGTLEISRGRFLAARQALDRGMARLSPGAGSRDAGCGLNRLGYVSFALGEQAEAFRSLDRAVSIFRNKQDTVRLAWTLNVLGHVSVETATAPRARPLLQESLELACEAGSKQRIASTLNSLAKELLSRSKLEAADELLEQSLHLRRGLGHRIGVADCLNNQGDVRLTAHDWEEALRHYRQALAIALEIQAQPLVMEIFIGLALVMKQRQEVPASASLLALVQRHQASWWDAKRRAASEISALKPSLGDGDFMRAVRAGRAMGADEAAKRFASL